MAKGVVVTISSSKFIRDALFAASALLRAVELADQALVTDDIVERAAELREVLEMGPISPSKRER